MSFFEFSVGAVFYRFAELIGAPFQNPSILWFGLPLIVTLIVIELNFPKKGWQDWEASQALPNAIVLGFIALDLGRLTFSAEGGFWENLISGNFLATLVVALMAGGIFAIDYKYHFPRKTLLGMSAHLPINLLAYTCMVIVYNEAIFDINSLFAILIFVLLIVLLMFLIEGVEPGRKNANREFSPKRHKPVEFAPKESKSSKADDASQVDLGNSKLTWLKK